MDEVTLARQRTKWGGGMKGGGVCGGDGADQEGAGTPVGGGGIRGDRDVYLGSDVTSAF